MTSQTRSPIVVLPISRFVIDGYNVKEGEPFDFSGASGWKNLRELEIRKTNGINTANIGTLSGLEKLNISDVNMKGEAFDLGFLKGLTGLKYLTINNSKVTGFDAIAGCSSLVNVTVTKTEGVSSLAALKQLPGLKRLDVTKGAFDSDLQGFANTVKINKIPFNEAIELAYYGATIIHPKTLKPLQNKNIVLKVQSFLNPEAKPTIIDSGTSYLSASSCTVPLTTSSGLASSCW